MKNPCDVQFWQEISSIVAPKSAPVWRVSPTECKRSVKPSSASVLLILSSGHTIRKMPFLLFCVAAYPLPKRCNTGRSYSRGDLTNRTQVCCRHRCERVRRRDSPTARTEASCFWNPLWCHCAEFKSAYYQLLIVSEGMEKQTKKGEACTGKIWIWPNTVQISDHT